MELESQREISKPEVSSETRWSTRLAPFVTRFTERILAPALKRPNRADVDPRLHLTHWPVVTDGLHNLTTDLAFWRGSFYLVHSSSPWHIASEQSKIVVWSSQDAVTWRRAAEFRMKGGDIRDPKLAVIGERLFLYVLRNEGIIAEPCGTAFSWSEDGVNWAPLQDAEPRGWLFWRPKTRDHRTWFVPAYWNKHGKSLLLKSTDGMHWESVGPIYEGDHNDETDIEFLPDGRMIATARLEMSGSVWGHPEAGTLIAVSEAPYTNWKYTKCQVTRLDGPNLFSCGGIIFAAGRHHPDVNRHYNRRGSFLGRKRTSLYRVEPGGLIHLTDLPSGGDTGYPGVVQVGEDIYLSYYTNDIETDYRWLPGMFLPSEIRMGKFTAGDLQRLAEEPPPSYKEHECRSNLVDDERIGK